MARRRASVYLLAQVAQEPRQRGLTTDDPLMTAPARQRSGVGRQASAAIRTLLLSLAYAGATAHGQAPFPRELLFVGLSDGEWKLFVGAGDRVQQVSTTSEPRRTKIVGTRFVVKLPRHVRRDTDTDRGFSGARLFSAKRENP
jgi:hypothetical protein